MKIQAWTGMSGSTFQQVGLSLQLIAKLAVLWIALLVLPFAERTLLGAKTYYFLYIGLGLVFVLYGLTIRSIFAFLQHTRREPFYVWIAFLYSSVFICCVKARSTSATNVTPCVAPRRAVHIARSFPCAVDGIMSP